MTNVSLICSKWHWLSHYWVGGMDVQSKNEHMQECSQKEAQLPWQGSGQEGCVCVDMVAVGPGIQREGINDSIETMDGTFDKEDNTFWTWRC